LCGHVRQALIISVQARRTLWLELWFSVGKMLYRTYRFLTKPNPNFGGQSDPARDKVDTLNKEYTAHMLTNYPHFSLGV
jgi:hypothetical protein